MSPQNMQKLVKAGQQIGAGIIKEAAKEPKHTPLMGWLLIVAGIFLVPAGIGVFILPWGIYKVFISRNTTPNSNDSD